MSLTPQQKEVVHHVKNKKVTIVSAGAGSGKTHTVVATFLELLEHDNADAGQFIIITFTRSAAGELRKRLLKGLSEKIKTTQNLSDKSIVKTWRRHSERLSGAFIGTIHSFCRQLLADYGYEVDIANQMNISFTKQLKEEAIRNAVNTRKSHLTHPLCIVRYSRSTDNADGKLVGHPLSPFKDYQIRALIQNIYDLILNMSWNPAQILEDTKTKQNPSNKSDYNHQLRCELMEIVVLAHNNYTQLKKEKGMVDSTDLLLKTHALLQNDVNQQIIHSITKQWKYLIVDEFQDTDELQVELFEKILVHLNKLLVVGDHKQSIYGFRGANNTLIKHLALKHTKDLPLPMSNSARSTQQLLDCINFMFGAEMIGCDRDNFNYESLNHPLLPMTDVTYTAEDSFPPMLLYRSESSMECVQKYLDRFLGQLIHIRNHQKQLVFKELEYKDIVILSRTNHTAADLYQECLNRNIPCTLVSGEAFYQNPEIIEIYRFLTCLLEWPDMTSINYLSNSPFALGLDLLKLVMHSQTDAEILQGLSDDFIKRLNYIKDLSKKENMSFLLWEIYKTYQLLPLTIDDVIQNHQDHSIIQKRHRNYYRLHEITRNLFNNEKALTLEQFTAFLKMSIESGRTESEPLKESKNIPNKIRIMTIHAAKGLEFPVVLVPDITRSLAFPEYPYGFQVSHNFVFKDWGLEPASMGGAKANRENSMKSLLRVCSQQYSQRYKEVQQLQLLEEMQILYVCMTRAQNQVVFLDNGVEASHPRGSQKYFWKSEIDNQTISPWIAIEDYEVLDQDKVQQNKA